MSTTFKPRLFVGSSSETLHLAEALARKLSPSAETRLWPDIFEIGDTTIESLMRELATCEFAVLIASDDDIVSRRGEDRAVPRDNIIFEAGLFIGCLGRRRVFVVCDVRSRVHLPSDLSGVTFATYDSTIRDAETSMEPVADKIVAAMSKRRDEAEEVQFLRSYLQIIHPETALNDTYADILTRHFETISAEVRRLEASQDWPRLLQVKQRLREYFEFSGRYRSGAEFGKAYSKALRNLGRNDEALWSEVKDIGYMLILDDQHDAGRKIINETINRASAEWSGDEITKSQLLFYANRYLGISLIRDKEVGGLERASAAFERAEEFVNSVRSNARIFRELNARLLGNRGHLALEQGNGPAALHLYRESLTLFLELEDREHIGIAHLHIAKALVLQAVRDSDDPEPHLQNADATFARLGWREGQGRVLEQRALFALTRAKATPNQDDARDLLAEAEGAARSARSLFERTSLARWIGRMDVLIEDISHTKSNLGIA